MWRTTFYLKNSRSNESTENWIKKNQILNYDEVTLFTISENSKPSYIQKDNTKIYPINKSVKYRVLVVEAIEPLEVEIDDSHNLKVNGKIQNNFFISSSSPILTTPY